MTFSNGINAPKENYGTGTKMISVMDILNPLPMKYDNILNSVAVDKKNEDKNKVEKGDLIFVRSSEIVEEVGWAKAYKEDRYALYSGFAIRGKRISSYNAYFIELTLNYANRKEIKRRAGGSTRFNVSQEILNSLNVLTPSISEQNQIDLFFTKIDDTIALHQRKLDKLKQLKQGYLQQLFPKPGETVPKIRFTNFEGEWKEHKLGEVADRFDNLRIPITASDRISGDIPYYGANGIQGYVEGFTHDGEFILVAEDGANNLKNYPVQYVSGRIWVNNHAHVLQGKKSIADNKFLMNAIKNFNIEPFLVGGGRAKLNADVMMKIVIKSPSHVEQQKIGTFFKQLDNITTLHQSKLDKLKLIKQSLLQKMFI